MKDMTQGKPLKLIIGFAVPMLIGNIFQQVYNVADTVIVGRFLGESALAGVGSTGTLTYFLLALVSGMCNGAGLVVAQCFGCGNKERLAKTVTALVWVAGMLTGIMSLIGIFSAEFFLRLLSVPENVMGYSAEYLHIIYTFVFGSVIYNGCAAILNSVGDSRTPLRAVIASSAVNIAFDLFFIIVCKMGVAGAAYATILAQCTSAVICFAKVWTVWRFRSSSLSERHFRYLPGRILQRISMTGSGKHSIRRWVSWWEQVFLLPPWYLFSGCS